MIEIRIHGRGGQGGVTLAKLIATSRFLQGLSVQAFGLYAAERSGAPIQAFCRFSEQAIRNRNLIYTPDHIIVLDPTLVGPAITAGLKPGGWILINTERDPEAFQGSFPANRIATVDATRFARENALGTRSVPIVNTALAGAVGRILGYPLSEMIAALDHLGFGGGNVSAAESAHQAVQWVDAASSGPMPEPGHAPVAGRGHSLLDRAGAEPPGLKTGQWATEQPLRQQMIPPCNCICPAGNDVQGFLAALARDDVDGALEILLRSSPFPSVCGRACPAPCMQSCNRTALDGAVNVRQMERYAGDHGHAEIAAEPARGEQLAVIGSGPAGLTAAYHLARFGYSVTVFESGPEPGGLLTTGIPDFRLPEGVVGREIDRIINLGVRLETNHPVDRPVLLDLSARFDAILVATGLQEHRGLRLGIDDEEGIVQGIDFLEQVHTSGVRVDGERVLVVGGGNTAMDAARSALRLGAASVAVVYRRSREQMPAIEEEVEEALEEGVEMHFLVQPLRLQRVGENGGPRYRLIGQRMRLGDPDASGRACPEPVPGNESAFDCDRVILALGQSPDLSIFPEGTEVRDGERLLGLLPVPVFAVGDLASQEGTIAAAIGSGRRSAYRIHEVLSGETIDESPHAQARRDVDVWRDQVARVGDLKMHLFERQPRQTEIHLPAAERRATFDEVHFGAPDTSEARRCMSCGVCNECDLCTTYCPEGVLKRVGHRLEFDYAYCKGCGVCVAECPRNVILMSHL